MGNCCGRLRNGKKRFNQTSNTSGTKSSKCNSLDAGPKVGLLGEKEDREEQDDFVINEQEAIDREKILRATNARIKQSKFRGAQKELGPGKLYQKMNDRKKQNNFNFENQSKLHISDNMKWRGD